MIQMGDNYVDNLGEMWITFAEFVDKRKITHGNHRYPDSQPKQRQGFVAPPIFLAAAL
jgi:hypothetical protein